MTASDQNSEQLRDEVYDLADAYYKDTASDEDIDRLRGLVCENDAARQYYLEFMYDTAHVDAWAREHTTEPTVAADLPPVQANESGDRTSDDGPRPDSAPTPHSKSVVARLFRHELGTGIGVAAMLFLAAFVVLEFTPLGQFVVGGRGEQHDQIKPVEAKQIATLTAWHRPEWVKQHAISPRNHRITAGQRVAFTSGLIEITYDTGAKVVIEGPAEFVVGATEPAERVARGQGEGGSSSGNGKAESGVVAPGRDSTNHQNATNGGFLQLGSLVARCATPQSNGFTIATPNAKVVDLSTEFGVDVDEHGKMQMAVLSGAVELIGGDGTGPEQSVRLVQGEGATIASSNARVTRPAKADVRLIAAMRERLDAALPAVADGSQAPARLIAHYEFEEGPGSGTTADSSGNAHTGTLKGGASIVEDPERGNVYQYQPDSKSNVDIDSTLAIPSLPPDVGATLAVWVRRDNVSVGSGGIYAGALSLGRDGDHPIMMISVANDGAVCGFIEGDQHGMDQIQLTGPAGAVSHGVWTHIAITFDRARNVAKMYVNGTQSGQDVDVSLAGDGPLNWSHANVGYLTHPTQGNVFPGLIDDARVYYGVLTAEEIRQLFDRTQTKVVAVQ